MRLHASQLQRVGKFAPPCNLRAQQQPPDRTAIGQCLLIEIEQIISIWEKDRSDRFRHPVGVNVGLHFAIITLRSYHRSLIIPTPSGA